MRRFLVPVVLAMLAIGPLAHADDAPLTPQQMAALEKEYDAAVQAARASLPVFWERLAENPGDKADFGLKVALHNPAGQTEELWLQDVERDGSRITGRLNYDPRTLPNLHRDDIVPIRQADIIDWSFKEGRKRYGEFTTRILAKVHPEQGAKSVADLSDNPLPLDARGK